MLAFSEGTGNNAPWQDGFARLLNTIFLPSRRSGLPGQPSFLPYPVGVDTVRHRCPMLLTLSVRSLWKADGRPSIKLEPEDVPRWARNDLGVHGLTIQTSLLAGWDLPRLDRFRDAADKAAAPCLVLVEDHPLDLTAAEPPLVAAPIERADRVLRVAHRLGCSSVAFSILDPTSETPIEVVAPRLKTLLTRAERLELNLLLAPAPGLTGTQERLVGLIRKVGGFRIGSYPDFETASHAPDPIAYLKGLTPYAACICASILGFDASGRHLGYDLSAYVETIQAVGFEATLALEFRGKGNPVPALHAAKEQIDACLAKEPAAIEEDFEDEEGDE